MEERSKIIGEQGAGGSSDAFEGASEVTQVLCG